MHSLLFGKKLKNHFKKKQVLKKQTSYANRYFKKVAPERKRKKNDLLNRKDLHICRILEHV